MYQLIQMSFSLSPDFTFIVVLLFFKRLKIALEPAFHSCQHTLKVTI